MAQLLAISMDSFSHNLNSSMLESLYARSLISDVFHHVTQIILEHDLSRLCKLLSSAASNRGNFLPREFSVRGAAAVFRVGGRTGIVHLCTAKLSWLRFCMRGDGLRFQREFWYGRWIAFQVQFWHTSVSCSRNLHVTSCI